MTPCFLRDPGLLHALLGVPDDAALLAHPRVGASWEGFVVEQILQVLRPADAWFRGAHGGGELDLLVSVKGRRIGFEVKFSEAPGVTKAMRGAASLLALDHLCPTRNAYPVDDRTTVLPVSEVAGLHIRIGPAA